MHLEFQSRNDALMALRYLDYGGELYRELRAEGAIAAGEACPILCVLLHNGRSPWTAATSTAELLGLPPALGAATVPEGLAAFHPWGYHPIDFVALAERPHVPGSVLSMMIGIEFARDRSDLVAPLWERRGTCATLACAAWSHGGCNGCAKATIWNCPAWRSCWRWRT